MVYIIFVMVFIIIFYIVYYLFVRPKGYASKEVSDLILSTENLRYQIALTSNDDTMLIDEKKARLHQLTNELDFLTLALNAKGYKYRTTTHHWHKK